MYYCDDCRRLTSGKCGKHEPIIFGSGMVQQLTCEHCFCKETRVRTDEDKIIPHKQCCNCGIKKVKEAWMSNIG